MLEHIHKQKVERYNKFFETHSQIILTSFNKVKRDCFEELKNVLPTDNKRTKLQIFISIDSEQKTLKIFTEFGTLFEFSVKQMLETGDTALRKVCPTYSKEVVKILKQCFVKVGYGYLLNFQKL